MYNINDASPVLANSIIWGNKKKDGTTIDNLYNTSGGTASYTYSLTEGSGGSSSWKTAFGTDKGHNLDADPLFTDPANGDYTLQPGSPAIDAGSNSLYAGLDANTKDMAGNPRVYQLANGGSIDLGAYESFYDRPVVTLTAGTTAFLEDENVVSIPVVIDDGITVRYVDNTTLAGARVSITDNLASGEDVLAFVNDGSGMGNITGSYDSSTGVLQLTSAGASATLSEWEAALRAITYTNSSKNPATANRRISFTVNDGSLYSHASFKTLTVTAVNDAPVVTATDSSTVYYAGTAIAVDDGITVSDVDNTPLASATVSLTAGFHSLQDMLAFTNDGSSMGNIAGSYDITAGILALTSSGATATIAEWQAALSAVSFSTNSNSLSNRTVSFTVNDGDKSSTRVSKTVQIASAEIVSVKRAGASSTNAASISYTVTFNSSVTFVATTVFDLSTTGDITGAGITSVAGSGAVYTVTVNTGSGDGTIRLNVNGAGISPIISNVPYTSGEVYTIDKTPPTTTVQAIALSDDSGLSATDFITNAASQTLSGTLSANLQSDEMVEISVDNGNTWTTATTVAGKDSYSLSGITLTGSNTIKVRVTDGAGNTGTEYTQDYVLDTQAPDAPSAPDLASDSDSGISNTDSLTNIAWPTFTGTAEALSMVTLSSSADGVIGTTRTNGLGNWSITPASDLSEGAHRLHVAATDAAGNTGAASPVLGIVIDVTAPAAPSNLVAISGDKQNELSWTAGRETDLASYIIYSNTLGNPASPLKVLTAPAETYTHTGLINGITYFYRVTAIDRAGNESSYGSEVNATPKVPQFTTFPALADKIYGDADIDPAATASSGLAISYTSDNAAVAKIVAGKIRIVGAGTATIIAIQQGNAIHAPAAEKQHTLRVSPKAITVSAQPSSITYGDADPVLSYQITDGSLVNGDTFSGSLSRDAGLNAGNYVINQGSLALSNNYNLTYIPAQLTINKAILTVTAEDKERCYGINNPTFTLRYSGFKNGETADNLSKKPVVSTDAGPGSPVAVYSLTAGGGSSANYDFNYQHGSMVILPLPEEVSIVSDRGTEVSKGTEVRLTTSGGSSYQWANSSGIISEQNSAVLTVRPAETTTYRVTVSNASGCHSIQEITVQVREDYLSLGANNILSPNGDGVNDYLEIKNIDMYPGSTLKIFDRAGRLLYSKTNYTNDWDGSFRGSPLAEDTYYYIVDFGPNKGQIKGFVTIVR